MDAGSGYAEFVQYCSYEVHDDYCEYEHNEWVTIELFISSGRTLTASWLSNEAFGGQRLGDRQESYPILFQIDDGVRRYNTEDYLLFQQAEIGSVWKLVVDGFGNIQEINP